MVLSALRMHYADDKTTEYEAFGRIGNCRRNRSGWEENLPYSQFFHHNPYMI
jgi:hypothetical protein